MKNYDTAFARLGKSKFRSRFHLSEADRRYIAEKGMATIRRHCEDFVRTRLAPANPPNDADARTPRFHRPARVRLLLPRLSRKVVEGAAWYCNPR